MYAKISEMLMPCNGNGRLFVTSFGEFSQEMVQKKEKRKKQRHGINKIDFEVVRRKKDLYN